MPRALVFIYVSWAIQARDSETACREFLETLRHKYPDEDIPVYRVDLTEQEGEVWDSARNWLKRERRSYESLYYGGHGGMLWVREGKVASFVHDVAFAKTPRMMAMTQEAFGLVE